ncbi:MAG: CPBP family intramembrane metalloprotease [Propionibacteriaceae bacterium]|nr:CPBP family intramembrane metalloprotease [Propionibacteriaceae bacterium]
MSAWTGVAWRRVALYYGIAFGGSTIAALVAFAARQGLGSAGAVVALVVTAVVYMPMPLVAGLITERVAGRRPLLADEWRALRTGFWRTYGRNALVAVVAIVAILAVAFCVAWLAGVLAVPGAGHLASPDGLPLPPAALVPVVIAEGVLAGVTINGLFAFGEEYGWRGVLAAELRPLGAVRANLVTGVLWGLWHAPIIILLGHNYGTEWGWGIPVMVAWVTPFSFLLWRARERTGSVLAPAMLHGAANGALGVFTLTIAGGSVLVALPVGLLLAVTMAIVALVAWHLPARTPA